MATYYPNIDPTYLFKRQGTANDPFIPLVQNITVKTQKVTLKEIPSYIDKVKVSFSNGFPLTEITGSPISDGQYRVDYSTGMVHFNSAEDDKELKFEYSGTGHVNIGANRILLNTSATNNEEVSVQEIIDDQIELYAKAQESKELIENNQAVSKSEIDATNEKLSQQIDEVSTARGVEDTLANRLDKFDFEVSANTDNIGNRDGLPPWLDKSLYEIAKMQNDTMLQYGVNVKMPPYNAKCDGITDDTEAIRAAIKDAEEKGLNLIIPGVSVITGELEFKKPLVVSGVGTGAGYGDESLLNYNQISGFLVKGTGQRRIRTRRKFRATAMDSQDNPLSVALNVQSDNVVFRDFTVFLDFDKTDMSARNYGADWDVGIFVGCRTHFLQENINVLGYFREAGWYYDVTHATNLPRFNALDGTTYDNTNNVSGGDGCTMIKCFARGAKWGVFVAGAIKNDSNTNYYDELLQKTVSDYRGSFGFSDFTTISCSFYGTDHHSGYRRDSASGNYLTDTSGGVMFIDGAAANGSSTVQGMRFISTRFASYEPFRVRLDRCNRPIFIGCHVENRSSGGRRNPDGSLVDFNSDSQIYGLITATTKTNNVLVQGISGKINMAFIPSSISYHNYSPAGDSDGTRTTDILRASRFQSLSGDLELRSNLSTDGIRFRRGPDTVLYVTDYFNIYSHILPGGDGTIDIGNSNRRMRRIYSNEIVFKSPDGTKNFKLSVDNNGNIVTNQV